ncbi:MAG: hypothetical protein HXL14_02310, partial [Parvimonas sp.]|nr:hypothetical protein [Parvimonas sp.]
MSNIEYIETVRLDYRLGNITEKQAKEKLKNFIKEFNEKYGIPKRWRAEEGEAYFYIDVYNNIEESVDNCLTSD